MAIADSPIALNTIDPHLKSVQDFREAYRIGMTSGKGTQHAVVLQMAGRQPSVGNIRQARCTYS